MREITLNDLLKKWREKLGCPDNAKIAACSEMLFLKIDEALSRKVAA
jgi:uncharacterized membrane protein YbaN (DUF454 family)